MSKARKWKFQGLAGILLIVLIGIGIFSGCGKKEEYITEADQLNDKNYTITLDAGSSAAIDAKKAFPDATFTYSQSAGDAYLAVSKGTADAFVYGKLNMQYAIASKQFTNLKILDDVLNKVDIAAGVRMDRKDLVEQINAFIKQIKSDGTFDDMYDRWVVKAEKTMPDIPKAENPDQTIRFGTSGLTVPMTYYGDHNELIGFDVEFIKRLALYMNVDYSLEAMGFDSLVTSLQTNRLDVVISDLNVTDERKEVIAFSDPYMYSETAVVVRKEAADEERLTDLSQLDGKKIGCLEGASSIPAIRKIYSNSTILEYASYADLIAALKSEQIAAYISDEPMVKFQLQETSGITRLDGSVTTDTYGFILNKESTELCEEINTALEELKQQGVLEQLKEKWVEEKKDIEIEMPEKAETIKGTLKVGLTLDSVPFSYLSGEELAGYDVELMNLIAQKLGYEVEYTSYAYSALLGGIVSGREDVGIGCITYTDERAESLLFTDTTYVGGNVAVILEQEEKEKSFLSNLRASFERTFIREDRWKLVVKGLWVTIELSFMTLIFGTLAGFLFSFPLRSKNKVISRIAGTISTILDGLPLLIILMVFYYIIFAQTTFPAVLIGVFGLSMDFANAVAGILNTGVAGVDSGQREAAEAMGYSRWKVFTKIVFPQAVNLMFGQYIGSVIGMIKGTSIIGYITVTDLTKAGDIIRSRTYEAFFPLLVIAAIYFLLSQIFVVVLRIVAGKIDPKHRKRSVKGVEIHD